MRLELTRQNSHYPLKVARLPIPPPLQMFVFYTWCPEQDSNLHVVKHTHLKRARLPIPPLGHKKILFLFGYSKCGAENGTRTRDPDLGKVVLYQLSYFRKHFLFARSISLNAVAKVLLFSEPPKLFRVFFQKSAIFIVFPRFSALFSPYFDVTRVPSRLPFSPSCPDNLRRRKCGEFPVHRQDEQCRWRDE